MTPRPVELAYRQSWGAVLAALIADVGDFDLAEESLQDAFAAAVDTWGDQPPDNPRGWLYKTARRRAIDRLRRRATQVDNAEDVKFLEALRFVDDEHGFADHRLRLVFTCCHPALSREAQVALTLRTVCGLTTTEIARAFLVDERAMAQRLVRAKKKIRAANIPYRVPSPDVMPTRLPALLAVVYLVFNEGYAATRGDDLVRPEVCDEAIRLGVLLGELMPEEPEVLGLLAVMILHHARRDARVDAAGAFVLLDAQDRTRWHRDEIARGVELAKGALRMKRLGPYQLQAAIAAVHAEATTADSTDWIQIAGLYGVLHAMTPTAVVALNRAVAVAMANGPAAGLALMDPLAADLDQYHLFHSAKAELLSRCGRRDEAVASFERALDLVTHGVERAFLEKRLAATRGAP